jgi:integrase
MGKIFQRTEGGSWYIKYYDPGKRYTVQECAHSDNYKKAERLLRERESAKDQGQPIASVKSRSTLMPQLFELLLTDYRNNKRKSLYTVEKRIKKHMTPFFGRFRACAVTQSLIEEYKAKRLSAGAANGTINRELASLKFAFRLATELGVVTYVPKIKDLEENNVREGYFSAEDTLKLMAQLPEELKALFEWDFCTGVRKSQSLSLKWNQVDRVNCVIRFGSQQTKNKVPHEILYADNLDLQHLIENQWKKKIEVETGTDRKIEFVFFRFNGKKAGQQIKDFRETFKTACRKAEITYGRFVEGGKIFHDFRKTAATNMRLAGVPETVVMMVTGHQTREVFERYNLKDPAETRKALSKVGIGSQLGNFEHKIEYNKAGEEPIIRVDSEAYKRSSTRNVQ